MLYLKQLSIWLAAGSTLIDSVSAVGNVAVDFKTLPKRQVNNTELSACFALNSLPKKSLSSSVVFLPLDADSSHWMTSSNQASACIYTPATPEDLAAGLKLIGSRRIRFAISCSNHASNQGFSSTPGIHISMHQFNKVTVSADKTYMDIGGGLSWAQVYDQLKDTGVNTVGGRVAGPGIGGFVTGGGGFSWKTNQAGLTGDNVISVDMVLGNGTLITASATQNADLWWAVRGGGNRFGAIYNFRMKAYPQSPSIYAGIAIFVGDGSLPAVLDAIAEFGSQNTDPLAQVIPTLNYADGSVDVLVLAVYDGVPAYGHDPFAMFNQTFQNTTFDGFVSLVQSSVQGGHRGSFHSANVVEFTRPVLDQIANQTEFWGKAGESHSANFISYDVEPFLSYSKYTLDAPYPHSNDPLPVNLFFAWDDASQDDYWHAAMIESANMITEAAKQDGQEVDGFYTYPNYALASVTARDLFGEANTRKLECIRQKYDPHNVMLLTTCFDFKL
ncbi:hypothetical protein AMS68_007782 [Peltaster fructicola]|uniref:FAD-binding PCMH-type domain-containing protein n=1 Tax=Peltaster fructicola TaxID=286661 RepID=A0A6H0Y5U5_9PEZI|nr:hypothetical protein AMS68_007782 [Peltaster fructicola]